MPLPLSASTLLTALGLLAITVPPSPHSTAVLARRHDVADAELLARGADPAYRMIAAVRHGGAHQGTGTLVAPTWVITDAHVVSTREDGRTTPVPASAITVRFDGIEHRVREVVIHPDYWAARNAGAAEVFARRGVDVALLRLEGPVSDLTPAALATADPAPGTLVTFVGRGTSGDAVSVVKTPTQDGQRRAGTNRVDQVGGTVGERVIPPYLLVGDLDHPTRESFNRTGSATPTEYEALPVGGDSGGPILMMQDGRPVIAGLFVTSSIAIHDEASDGIYGSVWYGTSAASIREWVRSVIE